MTLEKAIETLNDFLTDPGTVLLADDRPAIKLGIEALKAVKHNRHAFIIDYQITLPGETNE